MFILDKSDADITLTILAKTDAGRHRDLGVDQELLGELHRTLLAILLGYRCPGEHRCRRRRDVPAGALHRFDKNVAPRLVDRADLDGAVLRSVERRGRCDLD